jgi:polar amino acid transport system substrate-binding protein
MAPGLSIKIPCVGEVDKPLPEVATTPAEDTLPSQQPSFIVSSTLNKIELLTADGLAPFTGRSLPNGGMITELLSKGMELIKEESKGRFDYGVSWVNDWASHLNPLLTSRAFDAGYPWTKPDCNNLANLDADARYRCKKFFFSQPLYEILTHIFVKQNSKLAWDDEQKFIGRNFCRPTGYTTYEFDQGGRNWLKDNKITLMRPPSPEECFHLLETGSVDAVVIPDIVGQGIISDMRLGDKVRMLEKPLAINTLHVIVTKTHPQARTILYYVNASLTKLHESGEFDRVVQAHLSRFWDAQGGFDSSDDPGKRPIAPAVKGSSPADPPTSAASADVAPKPRGTTSVAKGDKK